MIADVLQESARELCKLAELMSNEGTTEGATELRKEAMLDSEKVIDLLTFYGCLCNAK